MNIEVEDDESFNPIYMLYFLQLGNIQVLRNPF